MSNTGGWVKSYRKLKEDGWFKDLAFAGFWHWLIQSAAFKECTSFEAGREIALNPGQLVFSYKKATTETSISVQTARTYIERLKINKRINIQTTNKYSIITIINWDTYQGGEDVANKQDNSQINRPATSKQQAEPVTPLYEEVKEYKENKELIHSCANAQAQERKTQKPKLKKETTFPATFLQFWNEFPKKRSKAQALKAWNNIPDPEALLPKILETIRGFKQSCEWQRDDGRFIPYPATWLNAARWDDEVPETQQFRKNDFKPANTGGTNQFLKMSLAGMKEEEDAKK